MHIEPDDLDRRSIVYRCLIAGGALVAGTARAAVPSEEHAGYDGWLNSRKDFGAIGDGAADDTVALQAAIDNGAKSVRPILLPPGAYKISRALRIPPNTMLMGSGSGLGFGCRIEPHGCAAFVIGGASPSFQCSIENLMIWPKGSAPDFIISIDNSFSLTFRNLRIHNAQDRLGRAAVLLLGNTGAGGHGQCNDILWENLVVRNDSDQPPVAVLAAAGCGTHRFIKPDLENYVVLLDWQGGQLDIIAPYTERAGRYGINCNPGPGDEDAYLNTFGGVINTADSGIACAIGARTRNFNSFGTAWGLVGGGAAYVYSLPYGPITFHGLVPNLGKAGKARFDGIGGWRQHVAFPQAVIRASRSATLAVPANANAQLDIEARGVRIGSHWARVSVNANARGLLLSAYASKDDVVTVVASNTTGDSIKLDGLFTVECGIA